MSRSSFKVKGECKNVFATRESTAAETVSFNRDVIRCTVARRGVGRGAAEASSNSGVQRVYARLSGQSDLGPRSRAVFLVSMCVNLWRRHWLDYGKWSCSCHRTHKTSWWSWRSVGRTLNSWSWDRRQRRRHADRRHRSPADCLPSPSTTSSQHQPPRTLRSAQQPTATFLVSSNETNRE